MRFPWSNRCKRPGIRHVARPSMKEQEDRVATVFTANRNPLLDASDGNVACLVNTLCGVNRILPCVALPQERKCLVELSIGCIVVIGRRGASSCRGLLRRWILCWCCD